MISDEILKKIKKIHIKSLRLVNSEMAGQYKSVFKGSGIEFEEFREYSFGDDVKHIDWKVSTRLNKPFIKRYKEERESTVILLIDMSASSIFGSLNKKIETAAETASILSFNAIKNNDKVGAIFFTDRVEKYIAPKKGSAHIWKLIKEIFTFKPLGKGTDIENAVKYLNKVIRKKMFVFIISDFLDKKNYLLPLKITNKKHEVINIILSDKNDFNLPSTGIFLFSDLETGKTKYFDASSKKTKKEYEARKKKEYFKIKESFKKAKIDYIEMNTDASIDTTLVKYFRQRERRKS